MTKLSKFIGNSLKVSMNSGPKQTLEGCSIEHKLGGTNFSEIAIDFTAPFIDESVAEVEKAFTNQGTERYNLRHLP